VARREVAAGVDARDVRPPVFVDRDDAVLAVPDARHLRVVAETVLATARGSVRDVCTP